MKTIEQTWEKRNLNLSTVEFRFDSTDCIGDISENILNNREYDYQICRIPSGKMDLVYFLQDKGFRFSEMNYQLVASLKGLKLNGLNERIIEGLDYRKTNEHEIEKVFHCIRAGVFDTDRIMLDPYFKKEQSGNRFANWAEQEISNGKANAYIVQKRQEDIGFFILKQIDEKVSYSLLAALFDTINLGLGFSTIYFPMLQAKIEGKKKITTGVSSNNLNSLKVHLNMGYQIVSTSYLLVKHIR